MNSGDLSPVAPAAHKASRRRWGGRVLLAAGGLILGLLAVEAGFRLFAPQSPGALQSTSLLRGEFTKPGDHPNVSREFRTEVHVNAEGFADKDWGPQEPGVPRVAVLGDSFVQAAQVSLRNGFGRVLERSLEAKLGRDVDVLSMGVPGAGTATELGVLEKYALPEHPDLVLLAFLPGNDILNNHPLLEDKEGKPFFALHEGKLVPIDSGDAVVPRWMQGPLWDWSHAWRYLARKAWSGQVLKRKIALGKGIPVDFRVYDPSPDPLWEEAWQVTDALFAEMARKCAAHGVGFATVLFPDPVQGTPFNRDSLIKSWPAISGWNFDGVWSRAAKLAGRFGPVDDLRPVFWESKLQLYFPIDGHWTAEGHALAAQAAATFVAQRLEERGFDAAAPPTNPQVGVAGSH
jgi:hypothetical protein